MAYTAPTYITSGTTFAQLQAGGLSALLEALITANGGGTAAPTAAPTLAASGSGSTLPATTYWVVCTESNGFGETTASPVSSSQAVTAGQNLVATYPSLKTNNVSRNLYVGTSSTGPFLLAASGVTASTTTLSAPLPTNSYAVAPPTINTTAFSYSDGNGMTMSDVIVNIRALKTGNFDMVFKKASQAIDAWLHGDPTSFRGLLDKVRHAHAASSAMSRALLEIGGLIDGNAGTLKPTQTGAGTASTTRSWP
jgi:hypothetical protein